MEKPPDRHQAVLLHRLGQIWMDSEERWYLFGELFSQKIWSFWVSWELHVQLLLRRAKQSTATTQSLNCLIFKKISVGYVENFAVGLQTRNPTIWEKEEIFWKTRVNLQIQLSAPLLQNKTERTLIKLSPAAPGARFQKWLEWPPRLENKIQNTTLRVSFGLGRD